MKYLNTSRNQFYGRLEVKCLWPIGILAYSTGRRHPIVSTSSDALLILTKLNEDIESTKVQQKLKINTLFFV